jgi:hypothetical protein
VIFFLPTYIMSSAARQQEEKSRSENGEVAQEKKTSNDKCAQCIVLSSDAIS